jgi:heme A synthase
MEGQQAKASKFVVNYGLLLGVLMIILGVVMYVLDFHLEPHWSLTLISAVIFIVVVVYGIKAFKKANLGFLSLGEGIKVAVGIALIAALLTGAWTILLSTVIEPDYMEQAIELQREKAFEMNPNMTDEQWENGLAMTEAFRGPWITFTATLVMYMLFGLIVGLIAAAIMKQKRPYDA